MNYLFFDTETTCMWDYKAPVTADHQPRLVQLGALLTNDEGKILGQWEFLVMPNGWEIEAGAEAVHGFSTKFCMENGISHMGVLRGFNLLCNRAHVAVAFNMDFDSRVMKHAFHRQGIDSHFHNIEHKCAMKPCTDVCKIPGPRGFKWPKLSEAHKFLFGTEFDGAHSALADTHAAARIWFELKRRGVEL